MEIGNAEKKRFLRVLQQRLKELDDRRNALLLTMKEIEGSETSEMPKTENSPQKRTRRRRGKMQTGFHGQVVTAAVELSENKNGGSVTIKEICDALATKGLRPGGKTNIATRVSGILSREILEKGSHARIRKTGVGLFARS